ncbi:MAG: hypothetical protein R2882_15205 [Gemmatimonadales bacterium]
MPERIGALGLEEYHGPPPDTLPLVIEPLGPRQYVAGRPLEIAARAVDAADPDSVTLFLKPAAGGFYRAYPMRPTAAYRYLATVPADAVRPGPYQFVIAAYRDGKPFTLPSGIAGRPWDWNYWSGAAWPLEVVAPATPLALFEPVPDADRMTFTRIGDAGRRGLFRLGMSPASGRPTFEFDLPVNQAGWSPDDYTASLVVLDRVGARGAALDAADAVAVRLRGLGEAQTLHLTLVEDDGTAWTTPVMVGAEWTERTIPLSAFRVGRSVLLPQGFPGEWNYWAGPAEGRGGSDDRLRPARIERLQLSLRRSDAGRQITPGDYGVEVESVVLRFGVAPR